MTQGLTRQQRKQLAKEAVKKGMALGGAYNFSVENTKNTAQEVDSRFQAINQDLQKILNYARYLENRVWLLTETLARMEVLSLKDISGTEQLYVKKEETKRERVKELLSKEMTVLEYLTEIKENPDLLGYQKLNIHPIKDLNLNPFEVASTIKEIYPDLPEEKYLEIGKRWDLQAEHFGIRKVN